MQREAWHWRVALIAAAGLILLLAVGTLLAPSTAMRCGLAFYGNLLVCLLALIWIAPLIRLTVNRRDRFSWLFIGAGVLIFLLGNLGCLLGPLRHHAAPVLGWHNLIYLPCFFLLWIGMLARSGQIPKDMPGKLVIVCDVIISCGATWTIVANLPLLTVLPVTQHAQPVQVLTESFPLLAMITLVCCNIMLLRTAPRQQHGTRAIFAAGVGSLLLGSAMLLTASLQGMPVSADAGWATGVFLPLSFLLIGLAARWETHMTRQLPMRMREVDPFPLLAGQLVPVILVLTALVLSVWSLLRWSLSSPVPLEADRLVQILISLTVLITLAMLRQIVTFEGNRQLYTSLQSLYHEMAYTAATDPLTRLANHRVFDERLEYELRRAQRYQHVLALIFVDIDHFKGVNDTYGHGVGDVALAMVADCLRAGVRETDLVARYGGEEFVILLPEASLSQATMLAERLRQTVSEIDLPLGDGAFGHITISGGVSAYPETADSFDKLVTSADHAMYQAKRRGRNCVVSVAPLGRRFSAR